MQFTDKSIAGTKRAGELRTRTHGKKTKADELKREMAAMGLSQTEYWNTYVKSAEDIVKFYELYHPEYPEILVQSIATRISGIVEKARRGEKLTKEEWHYIEKSKAEPDVWDPKEEIRQHELAAKVQLAVKRLEELKTG